MPHDKAALCVKYGLPGSDKSLVLLEEHLKKPQRNSWHRPPMAGVPTLADLWSEISRAGEPASRVRGGLLGGLFGQGSSSPQERGAIFDAWNGPAKRKAMVDVKADTGDVIHLRTGAG